MTLNQQIEAAENVANREPEDEDEDECAHQFQRTGRHHDGTQFYKCAKCGKQIST